MRKASDTSSFELFLFSTDLDLIGPAVEGGVDGLIVDWENQGKKERQSAADTQINFDTLEDLERVRRGTAARVLCRLNGYGAWTPEEVERAVGAGAEEVLLPMVRSAGEVEAVFERVQERCGVGILIETPEAVRLASGLSRLPLSRVFLGLNDLAIARGTPNIFSPLVDGTLERTREACETLFGFGGLTDPDRGDPIPCRLLIGEMARLDCGFSFLRRSFLRDLQGANPAVLLAAIRRALQAACERPPENVARDRAELVDRVSSLG